MTRVTSMTPKEHLKPQNSERDRFRALSIWLQLVLLGGNGNVAALAPNGQALQRQLDLEAITRGGTHPND